MDDKKNLKKKQRIITIIGLVFLFLVLLVIFTQVSSATTRHVGSGQPYAYIQDAINDSSIGDTVYVHEGTYNEHVTVNKTINLTGASWTNTTITQGTGSDTMDITSNWANISNFTVTHTAKALWDYGVDITAENVTISYCNISSNYQGFRGRDTSHNLTIHNCTIDDNSPRGSQIEGDCSAVRNCTFDNNAYSLIIKGSHQLATGNTFTNDSTGGFGPACAVDFEDAINVTLSFNTFQDNNYAIGFSSGGNFLCEDIDILNNTMIDNTHGIYIRLVNYTNITGNNFSSNDYSFEFQAPNVGWSDGEGNNIRIWDNRIESDIAPIKTFTTAIASKVTVTWNLSKTAGTNIVNGSNLGGNYWTNNYTGTDSDGDDIGDTVYNITRETGTASAVDYLPLVMPSECDVDADFVYRPSTIHPYTEVTFSDRSTGGVQRWKWDFGDGNTAAGKNQKHTYTESGTYTVTLQVYSSISSCNDKKTKTLRVTESDWHIIYPVDPKYPTQPYTVPAMYQLLNADGLPSSSAELTIVFIDSGYTPRSYNTTDLTRIEGLRDPSYASPYDMHGHGTWVSYALAYIIQSKLPNARLISYKIFDENGVCSTTQFLDALDQIKKLDPDVISFSGGGYGNPDDAFSKKIDELRASGILVVIAAGNYGPTPSTILSPACSRGAVGVGAVDPLFTINDLRDDLICIWSSRGPVPDVIPKPDFTSPGESIIGPWLKGETVASGTSMACPLIAGGSAVIMGNNKGILDIVNLLYFWDGATIPNIIEDSIKDTVVLKTPSDSYGWGIPDFQEAGGSVFWKCVFMIIIWVIVLIAIIIGLVFAYLYFKKDKKITKAIK